MRTAKQFIAFNGAYPRRDRKRVPAGDQSARTRFNGAYPRRDRKLLTGHERKSLSRRASMEPIPGGIGNLRSGSTMRAERWLQWSLSPEG